MHYVYILKGTNDFYYCGMTSNIARRIAQHNTGLSKSTRHHKPLVIVFCREVDTQSIARMCEVQIKNFGVKRWYEKNNTPELMGSTNSIVQNALDNYLHEKLLVEKNKHIHTGVEFLYKHHPTANSQQPTANTGK